MTRAAHRFGMSRPGFWHALERLDLADEPRRIREAAKRRYRLPPLAEYEKIARQR